jgi:hypothetical protein
MRITLGTARKLLVYLTIFKKIIIKKTQRILQETVQKIKKSEGKINENAIKFMYNKITLHMRRCFFFMVLTIFLTFFFSVILKFIFSFSPFYLEVFFYDDCTLEMLSDTRHGRKFSVFLLLLYGWSANLVSCRVGSNDYFE